MAPGELLDLLTEMLAGATGKTPQHWAKVLGGVVTYPLTTHPRSNWSLAPKGTADDVAAAHLAIDLAREQHPYVDHRP